MYLGQNSDRNTKRQLLYIRVTWANCAVPYFTKRNLSCPRVAANRDKSSLPVRTSEHLVSPNQHKAWSIEASGTTTAAFSQTIHAAHVLEICTCASTSTCTSAATTRTTTIGAVYVSIPSHVPGVRHLPQGAEVLHADPRGPRRAGVELSPPAPRVQRLPGKLPVAQL